jgi:hypothetical protein
VRIILKCILKKKGVDWIHLALGPRVSSCEHCGIGNILIAEETSTSQEEIQLCRSLVPPP